MNTDDTQDDITLDHEEGIDDSVRAEEAQGDAIKKLKEKLRVAEEKSKEHLDNWQRAQADFVNIRKRDEEAKVEFLKFAKSDTVASLLPVVDSMSAAIAHGQKDLEPIWSQLMQILKSHGLEEIDPTGAAFDPNHHEAISMQPTDNKDNDQRVVSVLQKGYALHGRTIRPAKVVVSEYTA